MCYWRLVWAGSSSMSFADRFAGSSMEHRQKQDRLVATDGPGSSPGVDDFSECLNDIRVVIVGGATMQNLESLQL